MKVLTRPIDDYKRIINDLLWLDGNHKLRFIVEMKYYDRNKNTKYYVSEFNTNNGSYIYLDLKYHLIIESISKDEITGQKTEFDIYNSNMYQFSIALENASQWLTNKTYANLFAKMSDGTIKCLTDINPIEIEDVFKHRLSFQPGVLNTDSRNESGIVMYIDDSDPIFLNGSAFMNFKYFMTSFNMHQTALQLITWLGKPEDNNNINYTSTTVFSPISKEKKKDGFLTRVNAKERNNND